MSVTEAHDKAFAVLCKRSDVSHQEAAGAAGVSESTFRACLRGRLEPDCSVFIRVLRAMGFTIMEYFKRIGGCIRANFLRAPRISRGPVPSRGVGAPGPPERAP